MINKTELKNKKQFWNGFIRWSLVSTGVIFVSLGLMMAFLT